MKNYKNTIPIEEQLRNANYAIRFLLVIIIIETLFLIF